MSEITEYIKKKRPTLSAGSLTTYTSILRSLYKKVFGDSEVNFSKFDDTDKVLAHLKDLPPNKRKTILSALVIVTDNKKYRDLMLEDVRDYNKEISKQQKTESQEANWVSQTEVREMFEELKKNANLIYKKTNKTNNDLQVLQNFIILALFTLIPPRRSKDYVDFKIKNINKDTDNYIEKGKLIFNSYKTAKTYGRQEVALPKELTTILNKWIKTNPTDYLLFDANMNPLSAVKLNQRFNRIFDGKKVSVNNIRHSYLTDKYAENMKVKKAMADDMSKMGSSLSQAETYVKLDD
jgi:integrase